MQAGAKDLVTAEAVPELIAECVRRFGRTRIRALGRSMFPAIRDGDVLHIERCAIEDVAIGDVVVVRMGARLIAHRAVDARGAVGEARTLVTQGDAHLHVDPPCTGAQLIGRVAGLDRDGRYLAAPFETSRPRRALGIAVTGATAAWRRWRAPLSYTGIIAGTRSARPR
jgi:hypothetical protein